MTEVTGNERRRDRAAQAIRAYDREVGRGYRSARLRGPGNAAEAIGELLCDLRHLADEFGLDWCEAERRAERFYEEESERYVVQVTTEGFQIRDTATDQLKADVFSSRSDAEQACEALNASAPARTAT